MHGPDYSDRSTFDPASGFETATTLGPGPRAEGGNSSGGCGCGCDGGSSAPPPKPRCERAKPKDKSTGELIGRLLGQGGDRPSIHKPKQKPNLKLHNLSCDWQIKESLGPILALIFRRAEKGLKPQNEFEKAMTTFTHRLEPAQRKALAKALGAVEAIAAERKGAFDDRFDAWPDDKPLDPKFISEVVLEEILALGRAGIFGVGDGKPAVGAVRPWAVSGTGFGEQSSRPTVAPWPWICAVNPGADAVHWYRNRDVLVPGGLPMSALQPKEYEYSMICTVTNDPLDPDPFEVHCEDNVEAPAGEWGFPRCDGGEKYSVTRPDGKAACLKIPECVAGQGVALRGFNFVSTNCKIRIWKIDGTFPLMTVDAETLPDPAPSTTAASCAIRDVLTFKLPASIPDGINDRDVPPGRYRVEALVPNETHYAPRLGPAPTRFTSNSVLIDVLPAPNNSYEIWCDRGDCFEETDGWGSDEPWFVAATGTFISGQDAQVPVTSHEIFKQEDIDSGDWIGFPPAQLFSGGLGVDGCVGIAILGLEVDSDDAAKDEIRDFWAAYGLYWKQALTVLASTASGGAFKDGLSAAAAGKGATFSLVAGGLGLVVVFALSFVFAGWAPADTIAFDLMVYDAVTLFRLTAPGSALPLDDAGSLGGITWSRLPQSITPVAADTAVYREKRVYRADDEGSRYGLDFRIVRQT